MPSPVPTAASSSMHICNSSSPKHSPVSPPVPSSNYRARRRRRSASRPCRFLRVEPSQRSTTSARRVRIDSMRTDFVANISHELKTPVGAIAVLAEMLADESDPTVVSTLSSRVVDESHRAARTIDDLLELSQIESSLTVLMTLSTWPPSSPNLCLVAEWSLTDAVSRLSRSKLRTTVWIRADRAQLSTAIGNSGRERGQVQRRWRAGPDLCSPERTLGRGHGGRPGRRHPCRRPRPRVRTFLSSGQGSGPTDRRNRSGAGNCAPCCEQSRRGGVGPVPRRGRHRHLRSAFPRA